MVTLLVTQAVPKKQNPMQTQKGPQPYTMIYLQIYLSGHLPEKHETSAAQLAPPPPLHERSEAVEFGASCRECVLE